MQEKIYSFCMIGYMFFGQKKKLLEDRRHTAEGSPRGYRVMVLGISILLVLYVTLSIGLVFSGFVIAAKKAQRRHEESTKKGMRTMLLFLFLTYTIKADSLRY